MTSLTVTPTSIGVTDSATVTCIAHDLDGDTLVYDWDTDLRLNIRGEPANYPTSTNRLDPVDVFYPNYHPAQPDSVVVFCTARDRRGGSAVKFVTFVVHP